MNARGENVATPDDFEIGDEPIEVERKQRAGVVISVRLSPEEADQLQQAAARMDLTVSQVLRRALGGFLRGPADCEYAYPRWTATKTGTDPQLETTWYPSTKNYSAY